MKPEMIATAPRDGSEIIGIWQDATGQDYAALMRWVKAEDWADAVAERDAWWGYSNSLTQIEFADDSNDPAIKAPTHWLPYQSPFNR